MTVLETIHASLFYQLAAILLLAGLLGFIGMKLRQPLVVTLIVTGILSGPDFLGIISIDHLMPIATLAKLGIALLLFMVGLKLDLTLIRTLGRVSMATAVGQMAFTALAGFFIARGFGFNPMASAFVGVAMTFSSTIIIVKLLSDKREIDSLHGRIALGFLIVEDLFVILYMVLLSTFSSGELHNSLLSDLGLVILKMGFLMSIVVLFVGRLATPLTSLVAQSPELMVTFSVGWAMAFAALADILGFSIELGGLLAGVALASTPYKDVLAARLSSLRDFMLLFFFIVLGSRMDTSLFATQFWPALALSAFVLIAKPLTIMTIMGFMGYRKRTSFLAGLTVGQISEFSLIFVTMGISLGYVSRESLGLVTLVALITIFLSTYMIIHSQKLYRLLEPYLDIFERKPKPGQTGEAQENSYDAIVFGLGRYGLEIVQLLLNHGASVLGLDFDPDILRQAKKICRGEKFDVAYGDVVDPNAVEYLPLDNAEWIICAVPHPRLTLQEHDVRMVLLETLRSRHFKGKIAMVSHSEEESEVLKANGVTLVLTPFSDAAGLAVSKIMDNHQGAAPSRFREIE
jgi:Kef-type K+ transport system membrane component KefB